MHSPKQIPKPAQQIIHDLKLLPHPREGGFFVETHRSTETALVDGRQRSLATAIYFLVLRGYPTELHRLPGDELFHFYSGDPLELFLFDEESGAVLRQLGTDLGRGMRPQITIPGGVWQAARVINGGLFSLVGTTMAPGFDFADYQALSCEEWGKQFPEGLEGMTRFYGEA